MLAPLSTNRNTNSCCDYIRPYIFSVSNTTATTTSTTSTTVITTGDTTGDTATFTTLNVDNINATTITTSSLTTFSVSLSAITNTFSVTSGNDVTFIGTELDNRLFWDSSADTLYIDGHFKVRDCFVYLCANSDENPPGITDANKDSGVLFNWYDDTPGEAKLGFFGFNDDTERFTFIPNVGVTNGVITGITDNYGDLEMRDLYINGIINEIGSQNLHITSVSELYMVSNNNMLIGVTSGNMEIINESGDINIDTKTGDLNISVTGDMISNIYGSYDLLVNGITGDVLSLENTYGTVDILSSAVSDQAIYLNTIYGGIFLDNQSPDRDIEIKTTNNTKFTTSGSTIMNFNDTDGLTVNIAKTDYLKWIPFYNFDAFSGIWINERATPSNPIHYWRKEATAETAIIYTDIDLSSRTTTDKGYQLKSILFAYSISTQTITSITPTITLMEFDSGTPLGGPSLTNISYTDVNLSTGTSINQHYRSVDITTPFYLNSEGILNIELAIQTNTNSVFDFYGIHLIFDNNST